MAVQIQGSGGTTLAVEAASQAARVLLYDAQGNVLSRSDGAALPATPTGLLLAGNDVGIASVARADVAGGLASARSTLLFQELPDGATVNTQQWTQSLTTMTVTQATRLTTMNAGSSVAAGAVAIHTSLRLFEKRRLMSLVFAARVRFSYQSSNAVMECGLCNPSGVVTAVPNGVFLRVQANGDVRLVQSYNSAEAQSSVLAVVGSAAGQLNPSSWYNVTISVFDDAVACVVRRDNDALGGVAEDPVISTTMPLATGTVAEWNLVAVPAAFRVYNNTAPASASQLLYSGVSVLSFDDDRQKPWPHQLAAVGRGFVLNPATGAQLANYANSAAPASATLSNTAAGYTTLGGQWQFVAVAGAETDYALFAFTVPTGRTLHVTGVRIESFNMGAAVATTNTLLQWGIGRAAAVTLAASSFRVAVGAQSFAVGAVVGALATPVDWRPATPFVVDSAQIFHVILKMPVSSATASQILRGVCAVVGYLE